MNVYLKALRAPFLLGSLIPVIIGSALAFSEKIFSISFFLITALGVAALHLGANLLNDYCDARGSDSINVRLTPFSGGSRVIQNREIAPWTILLMSSFFFAFGLAVGIWLVYLGRPFVIAIGLFGFVAGWAYSAPPLQLMSRGWGEVLIFFAFGPFITLGTYYVMSGSLSWQAFALGFPQGFFIVGVIWINQFPDYQADREAGKKNLVVRWGPDICRYLYCVIMLLAFVVVILLISIVGFSYLIMLSFVALPLAAKAMKILWKEYLSHKEVIPAQALTIQTLIVHGMFLSIGIFLSRFICV
ncbi:MAG: 1,4-dihydroxy-2-naphthoate octaprenyltransferase [Desulfobacteraceae bacterium]|nr:1,4-dihydroxy-2-naphthoate octaprenyltransferase [Desulfobacteraceae bacterium]